MSDDELYQFAVGIAGGNAKKKDEQIKYIENFIKSNLTNF